MILDELVVGRSLSIFLSSMFPQSLRGVPHRPLVRILLLLLFIVILFVTLHPVFDANSLLWNVSLPRPPLHSSPFVSPHPRQQSGHRIKVQRPPVEPAHGEPWAQRADAVRGAFLHAYGGYLTHAAPHDELLPLTKSPVDKCVCSLPRTADRSLRLTRCHAQLQRLGCYNRRFSRHDVAHGPVR